MPSPPGHQDRLLNFEPPRHQDTKNTEKNRQRKRRGAEAQRRRDTEEAAFQRKDAKAQRRQAAHPPRNAEARRRRGAEGVVPRLASDEVPAARGGRDPLGRNPAPKAGIRRRGSCTATHAFEAWASSSSNFPRLDSSARSPVWRKLRRNRRAAGASAGTRWLDRERSRTWASHLVPAAADASVGRGSAGLHSRPTELRRNSFAPWRLCAFAFTGWVGGSAPPRLRASAFFPVPLVPWGLGGSSPGGWPALRLRASAFSFPVPLVPWCLGGSSPDGWPGNSEFRIPNSEFP